MEEISQSFRPILFTLAQLVIVIASYRYLIKVKSSNSKLLFFGSLLVFISYTFSSFSTLIIEHIDFDAFLYGLIFGLINLISLTGLICFAIGFYNLIKQLLRSKQIDKDEFDSIGKH